MMGQARQRRLAVAVMAAGALAMAAGRAAASGSAVASGSNDSGQLGNNSTTDSISPVNVTGLTTGVMAVAAGGDFSLAVQNGSAYAWGDNTYGELGNGSTASSSSPVAVTGLSSGVTAVAGGGDFSLAVKGGAVYAWGFGGNGELGNGSTSNSNTPVAASVVTSGVTAVAAGDAHALALQGGKVYAWGYNGDGQLGNGSTTSSSTPVAVSGLTSGVTAIAAGYYHSLAVQNGAAYAWGYNSAGQLGDGSTTNRTTPVAVSGLTSGVTAVAAGYLHSLAVQNGSVYAWGNNTAGQLGNGSTTASHTPVAVTGITGTITAVAAGYKSSYALAADGSLWDWGDNSSGELGLGTTTSQYDTPQHLSAPAGYAYTSVSASDNNQAAHVVATLGRPVTAIASSAVGTSLGTVAPAGSDAAGYTEQDLVLSGLTVSGSVQINPNLSNTKFFNTVYLKLNTPSQATALIADLNTLYGAGTAATTTGTFQVSLRLPTAAGSPDFFNFDFTTVVNAGAGGDTVGSVDIDELGFTAAPEPTSLCLLTAAVAGLLGRRQRRARG